MYGEFTTQFRIGQYDFQFSIGDVNFSIESKIKLTKNDEKVALWEAGNWPGSEFYNVMNINVDSYNIPNDREIVIVFNNGYSMHIYDNSDQYESMSISIDGDDRIWII
nr:putative integron gene cassette protein [uncultured bacterium]